MGKIYKVEFRVRCSNFTHRAEDEEDAYRKMILAMTNGCTFKHWVDVRVNGRTWSKLYDEDSLRRFLASKTNVD